MNCRWFLHWRICILVKLFIVISKMKMLLWMKISKSSWLTLDLLHSLTRRLALQLSVERWNIVVQRFYKATGLNFTSFLHNHITLLSGSQLKSYRSLHLVQYPFHFISLSFQQHTYWSASIKDGIHIYIHTYIHYTLYIIHLYSAIKSEYSEALYNWSVNYLS